jgi:hypothetical protein
MSAMVMISVLSIRLPVCISPPTGALLDVALALRLSFGAASTPTPSPKSVISVLPVLQLFGAVWAVPLKLLAHQGRHPSESTVSISVRPAFTAWFPVWHSNTNGTRHR